MNNNTIKHISDEVLLKNFEECLNSMKFNYNNNMDLYRESEIKYDVYKTEILSRYRKN